MSSKVENLMKIAPVLTDICWDMPIFVASSIFCPFRNASLPDEGHFANLAQNWLPW